MSGEEDLSGHWRGFFNYPSQFPPNEFEADLTDRSGTISGLITQPGEFFYPPGTILQAVVEGESRGKRAALHQDL